MNISVGIEEYRKTPVGEAQFVYISQADTKFDAAGVYHVSVEYKEDEVKEEIQAIEDAIKQKIAEINRAKPGGPLVKRAPLPYKKENGKVVMKFKSKFKPRIWDKDGKPFNLEKSIYKGSTMKIKYKLNAYDQNIGVGCSLYLLHCGIESLVEGSGDEACPF